MTNDDEFANTIRAWFRAAGERVIAEYATAADPATIDCVVVIVGPEGVDVIAPTSEGGEPERSIFERKVRTLGLALMAEALDGPGVNVTTTPP